MKKIKLDDLTKGDQTISFENWNTLLDTGLVNDISHELPDGFLMIYQVMRGKIEVNGNKYYVSGWQPPNSKGFVTISQPGAIKL